MRNAVGSIFFFFGCAFYALRCARLECCQRTPSLVSLLVSLFFFVLFDSEVGVRVRCASDLQKIRRRPCVSAMFSGYSMTATATTGSETFDGGSDTGLEDEQGQEQEFVFKVVVVGEYSVGKTSLVRRLLTSDLTQQEPGAAVGPTAVPTSDGPGGCEGDAPHVVPTIGTDFFSRVVPNVRQGKHVRLQFWDTAGLERYAAVHASTYRAASVVVAVFDVADRGSFQELVLKHLEMAARHNPDLEERSVVVVANKVDLLSANTKGSGSSFVTQVDVQTGLLDILPGIHYHEVSARTNVGVSALLQSLCDLLLSKHVEETADAKQADAIAGGKLLHSLLPARAPEASTTEAVAPSPSLQLVSMEHLSESDEFSTVECNSDVVRDTNQRDVREPELHVDPLMDHADERLQTSGVPLASREAAGADRNPPSPSHLGHRELNASLHWSVHGESTSSRFCSPPGDLSRTRNDVKDSHFQLPSSDTKCRQAVLPGTMKNQTRENSLDSSDSVNYQERIASLYRQAEQRAQEGFAEPPVLPTRKRKSRIMRFFCCAWGSSDNTMTKKSGC